MTKEFSKLLLDVCNAYHDCGAHDIEGGTYDDFRLVRDNASLTREKLIKYVKGLEMASLGVPVGDAGNSVTSIDGFDYDLYT